MKHEAAFGDDFDRWFLQVVDLDFDSGLEEGLPIVERQSGFEDGASRSCLRFTMTVDDSCVVDAFSPNGTKQLLNATMVDSGDGSCLRLVGVGEMPGCFLMLLFCVACLPREESKRFHSGGLCFGLRGVRCEMMNGCSLELVRLTVEAVSCGHFAMIARLATIGVDEFTAAFPDTIHPNVEFTRTGRLVPSGMRPGTRNKSKKISAPIIMSTGLGSANDGSASCIPGGRSQLVVLTGVVGRSIVTLGRTRNSTFVEYFPIRDRMQATNFSFAFVGTSPMPVIGMLIDLRRTLSC